MKPKNPEKSRDLTLMAVHAHPDDEAIGTGGILSKYAAEGIRTIVVFGTRATVQSSIDIKRNSTQIVDGLSAEAINKDVCVNENSLLWF